MRCHKRAKLSYPAAVQRATVAQMETDPVGRYVAGETYAHFCAAPTLWGVIVWGRPTVEHALALGRSLVLELAPPAVEHVSVFDASRIEGVDLAAFQSAGRYLSAKREPLSQLVRALALIRPTGLEGAVIAGAFDVLPRPYPARVFATADEATRWLREQHAHAGWPVDLPALLDEIHAEAANTAPLVISLRAAFEQDLALSLSEAARRLGTSERTLQRKLAELETTFQEQHAMARLRVAKHKLVDGNEPLTHIALDLGFASLQHFSADFRKRENESPSAYRARHRKPRT